MSETPVETTNIPELKIGSPLNPDFQSGPIQKAFDAIKGSENYEKVTAEAALGRLQTLNAITTLALQEAINKNDLARFTEIAQKLPGLTIEALANDKKVWNKDDMTNFAKTLSTESFSHDPEPEREQGK